MCTGDFSPTIMQPGHEADHSPHLVLRLKMSGCASPCLIYAFMACTGTTITFYQMQRNVT